LLYLIKTSKQQATSKNLVSNILLQFNKSQQIFRNKIKDIKISISGHKDLTYKAMSREPHDRYGKVRCGSLHLGRYSVIGAICMCAEIVAQRLSYLMKIHLFKYKIPACCFESFLKDSKQHVRKIENVYHYGIKRILLIPRIIIVIICRKKVI